MQQLFAAKQQIFIKSPLNAYRLCFLGTTRFLKHLKMTSKKAKKTSFLLKIGIHSQ